MTVIPTASELIDTSDLAVPLPRYAQIIRYEECPFFGVNNRGIDNRDCDRIFTKPERDMVIRYLAEAQLEIERVTNFPLSARWIENEELPYQWRSVARWGKVVEAGVKATTTISASETIDTSTDPGVVGPVATTVTDESEIHIFHPGTDVEIHPSQITISGGNVTILVPRCRTVKEDFADNPRTGLDYGDLNNFESEVDVKRVYNDGSTQATLNWPHGKSCPNCTEATANGCISVIDGEVGTLDVLEATYSSGAWARSCGQCCACVEPSRLFVNYRAGLVQPIDQHVADTVVRLAHSKMPQEPCACDVVSNIWQRDREQPEVSTAERLQCPFGINNGAWIAWRFAQTYRLVRGGVLV